MNNEEKYFYRTVLHIDAGWGGFYALESELKKREVSCDFCPLRSGRFYRIPESQLSKLPFDPQLEGHYLPAGEKDESGWGLYPLKPEDAQAWIDEQGFSDDTWHPVLGHDYASVSPSGKDYPSGVYPCKYSWGCFTQAGGDGIVIDQSCEERQTISTLELVAIVVSGESSLPKGYYRTAFFEAFPRNPDTFLRGEGKTIQEAEEKAWKQFEKLRACPGHEFEARGYENGGGFCKHCGKFGSNVIAPIHACPGCGKLNWFSKDNRGEFWCQDCTKADKIPEESMTDIQKEIRVLQKWGRSGKN